MNTSPELLAKLDGVYNGYLEGALVDQFLADFGIRFAAGHWCGGEFFDRFCTVGYNCDKPGFDAGIHAQIERVAAAGIEGIEFHDVVFLDDQGARNDAEIAAVKASCAKYKLQPTNMNFMTWATPSTSLAA